MSREPIDPIERIPSIKRKNAHLVPEAVELPPVIFWRPLPERFLSLIHESSSKVIERVHRNLQKMREESSEAARIDEARRRRHTASGYSNLRHRVIKAL